jgi:DNA-binding beta-propeller fold protein YncE
MPVSRSVVLTRRGWGTVVLLAACLTALGAPDALGGTLSCSRTVTAGTTSATAACPFTVGSSGTITAQVSWAPTSAVLSVALLDPSGALMPVTTSGSNPTTVTGQATGAGIYKVRVKAKSGGARVDVGVTYPGVSVPSFAGQIGGGLSGHATTYPGGVAIGPDGTIYVADTGNDQVEVIDGTTGALLHRWGTRGLKPPGNFNNPRDIAYLGGLLYIDDEGNNHVQVLKASDGTPVSNNFANYVFPSALGISAGVDSVGQPIILLSEDTLNQIAVFSTDGTPRCTIPVPTANGLPPLPRDAATNAAGAVYVAAYQNDRIDVFGPVVGSTCPQSLTKTIGSSGAGTGQFKRPYGVDFDSNGNLFVADSANDRIEEFSSNGDYENTYGANFQVPGGDLHDLRRVAVADGQVYGADLWGVHIDQFPIMAPNSPDALTPAATYPANYQGPADGFFNEPSGLTFDGSGTLDVADSVNQRIQPFAPGADGATWTALAPWGARGWGRSDLSGFNWPRGITYAPATNTLWVADTKNQRLLEFTPDGTSTMTFIGSKTTMNWPYGIAASGSHVIAAQTFASPGSVDSWNPDGSAGWAQPFTATADGTALKHPYDVAVSAAGTAYVADAGHARIVELSAGTGSYQGCICTHLHLPQGVAVDPTNGNIWVSDTSYNQVVEFDSQGHYIQAVKSFGSGGTFNRPTHLGIHTAANGHAYLYVCDTYSDRIVILDLNET